MGSASEDPSLVDSATLAATAAQDIERAYDLLRLARVALHELHRRSRQNPEPVLSLKTWRKARGLTQVAAAELLGISRVCVIKYEANPGATPRVVRLAAQALG